MILGSPSLWLDCTLTRILGQRQMRNSNFLVTDQELSWRFRSLPGQVLADPTTKDRRITRLLAFWRRSILLALAAFSACPGIVSQYRLSAQEPFGAEDKGSESRRPSIPEPMVFDLVRSLGARRGEMEVNVLGEFPIGKSRSNSNGFDPLIGSSEGERGDAIEWAPEIEYALWDGFAIEFELPFENSTLEAYKFAAQWTFGTALDDRFIDGAQIIIEPDVKFQQWDLTFLYLAGMQFNERWRALGMIGVRPEIEQGEGFEHLDGILNATVFRDLDFRTTVGLETNLTFGESDRTSFLLIPQIDREMTDNLELQIGAGVRFFNASTEPLAALRVIYSR